MTTYGPNDFTKIRLQSRVPDESIRPMIGRILTNDEYDLLISGPTSITVSDGQGGSRPLLKYLPAAFSHERMDSFYAALHELKEYETTNRGNASGTQRFKSFEESTWTYSKPVASAIIGAFDPLPPKNYCRLTAWTGKETEKFSSLFPLFQDIGRLFAEHVPDRFANQMKEAARTSDEWVIPGTPFTTITVNNTYPTGVHTDKGDLDAGFSTLACLRRGSYRGGRLVMPQWRVAVDMQDGDLLLMDAHEWHGNTQLQLLDPPCLMCEERATIELLVQPDAAPRQSWKAFCVAHGEQVQAMATVQKFGSRDIIPAERISIVSYFRSKMVACGTPEEELAKAQAWAEKRIAIGADAVEEMAVESAEMLAATTTHDARR